MQIKIDLPDLDFEKLKTEENIREEAKSRLPGALIKIGEASSLEVWKALQKSPFKPVPATRSAFVKKGGSDYLRSSTTAQKKNVENMLFHSIQEAKQKYELQALPHTGSEFGGF